MQRHRPFPFRAILPSGGILCGLLAFAALAQQAPKSAPISKTPSPTVITGRVTVPEGQRLPEMVVYLESTDPAAKFPAPAKPISVSQKGAKFAPGLLVVPVGSKVDFLNDEPKPIEHNVFSSSEAKQFDLGLYKPGDEIEPVLFDQPGPVRLRCSIHRYMDGVVYVAPTPFFAIVGKDGSFSISVDRPGKYRLKTWQRSQRYPEHEQLVDVAAGKPVKVNVGLSRK